MFEKTKINEKEVGVGQFKKYRKWLWLSGRVVASNSRGLWFEFSHRQKNYIECLLSTVYKDKNKEKSGRDWQFEKEEEITD